MWPAVWRVERYGAGLPIDAMRRREGGIAAGRSGGGRERGMDVSVEVVARGRREVVMGWLWSPF